MRETTVNRVESWPVKERRRPIYKPVHHDARPEMGVTFDSNRDEELRLLSVLILFLSF